ncbi:MAG: hypothetical protein AVDCRST_MAG89-5339 [uncultured Gemmatimonadetes bacterium]|uniref:Lipoprotein n=1 Tax=uncultured Gemmatimonadota bacterium TaxID=203437 RepID=A0A6J4N7R0_9BACT|nr:MAG: hypothetical protein AVDCRST_MAG89-5339 [uncultured Gemmatimonadota bacterium]
MPYAERTVRAMYRTAPAFLALLLAACGDEITPEQRTKRLEARRTACITEALQQRAQSQLAQLDTMMRQQGGNVPDIVRAPHTFAQVYAAYADVKAHEAAYLDSAFQADSKQDSIAYLQSAGKFRVSPPSEGSVEENVARLYAGDFNASREYADHACNKLVEDQEKR